MGVELVPDGTLSIGATVTVAAAAAAAPTVVGLQPVALIDHVARVDWSLLENVPGERGGSIPVAIEELEHILQELKTHVLSTPDDPVPVKTMAGGSVANTVRGLSAGFGVSTRIVGAFGDDDQGQLFVSNMSFNGVDLSRMRNKKGPTGQCVCLVDASGNRTMRPCLSSAVKLQADGLMRVDFKGSKWLVLRYAIFNLEVIKAAITIAKQEGLFVSLDLASFEMVRNFRLPLLELLQSGNVDLCFANEDEATELTRLHMYSNSLICLDAPLPENKGNGTLGLLMFCLKSHFSACRGEENAGPDAAVEYLSNLCKWAVVTLGSNGCIAKHGKEIVRVPAIGESKPTDATGAGDLFASGFLYGMVKELSLEDCCKVGSCSGGSVIRSLGGEVTPDNWQWMYKQMHGKGLPLPEIRN